MHWKGRLERPGPNCLWQTVFQLAPEESHSCSILESFERTDLGYPTRGSRFGQMSCLPEPLSEVPNVFGFGKPVGIGRREVRVVCCRSLWWASCGDSRPPAMFQGCSPFKFHGHRTRAAPCAKASPTLDGSSFGKTRLGMFCLLFGPPPVWLATK